MTGVIAPPLLDAVKDSLSRIKYPSDLVRRDYAYADFLGAAGAPALTVPLAAFAQEPASFRTACLALVAPSGQTPAEIARYRAFGAPIVFAADPDGTRFHRWNMTAEGDPEWREAIAADALAARILDEGEAWGPEYVFRAKLIGRERGPAQLDIFDTGLIPLLERDVQRKLGGLLQQVLAEAQHAYRETHRRALGGTALQPLYRLVFRLLSAKILLDRRHPDFKDSDDATTVLREVGQVLLPRSAAADVLADPRVRATVWGRLRGAFDLSHVSAEALAYVWEDTLVSPEARRRFDIHATPPEVAEYVARGLPLGTLPQEERRVFEPFTGHGPFLIAAMGQLKALLPVGVDAGERHAYLTRMLWGMELDPFAHEVAQQSLVLADYPRGNGWQILADDVFTSEAFDVQLAAAGAVLCNPPFSKLPAGQPGGATTKAEVAALRILRRPPPMLGLVLPLAFVNGARFGQVRRLLSAAYADVQTLELPDIAFNHADIQTAVVLAAGRRVSGDPHGRRRTAVYVSKADYPAFLARNAPTWREEFVLHGEATDAPTEVWRTPLHRVWQHLERHPRLADAAVVKRGLEYFEDWGENQELLTSRTPEPDFGEGFGNVTPAFEPYVARPDTHLLVDPERVKWAHATLRSGEKVVVNKNRLSREWWTLNAVVDRADRAFYQNFVGVWPTGPLPAEVLAAVLNGPVANAYVASHERKYHIRVETLRQVPLPRLSAAQAATVAALVRAFEEARRAWMAADVGGRSVAGGFWDARAADAGRQPAGGYPERCEQLLREIDAAVLAAYRIPARLERFVLDLFAGQPRRGPTPFERYYPEGYAPNIPYAMYLNPERQAATAQRVAVAGPRLHEPAVTAFVTELLAHDAEEDPDDGNTGDRGPGAAGADA